MEAATIIGLDLAKRSFQTHGALADGRVAFRKKLTREKTLGFLAEQPRCVVAMDMSNPFRYFNSSPEVIRLVVMMYVRYPLSLRNVEICWPSVASTSAMRPSGSGGTGLAQCSPPRSARDESRTCAAILSGADGVDAPS